MQLYLGVTANGVEIVAAQLEKNFPTYRVVTPHGVASSMGAEAFEIIYRKLDRHEMILISQHDAEHQVSAISDGEPNVTEEPDHVCLDTVEALDVWNQDHPREQAKLGDTVRIRW